MDVSDMSNAPRRVGVGMRGAVWLALLAVTAGPSACRKYEETADFCSRDDECLSRRCDLAARRCVAPSSADGGAAGQAGTPGDGGVGNGGAGGYATGVGGAAGGAGSPAMGTAGTGAGGLAGMTTGGGGSLGARGGGPGAAASGGTAGVAPPIGGAGGGGRGGCAAKADCASTPATPVCDTTTRACVGCLTNGDCSGGTAVCNTTTRTCVECATDVQCTSAAKPFCSSAGACVGCAMAPAGATACAKKDAAHPVCAAAGACVECAADADCHDATKPLCAAATATCVPCSMGAPSGAAACARKDAAHPACGSTGACAECAADADCHDASRAFCASNGTCVGCAQAPAGAGACAARDRTKPACAASGACVTCVANADCPNTTPVCSASNACGPCSKDGDCSGRAGPGVCMSHQDGRCADDAETLYVQATSSCSDASGAGGAKGTAGTSATPLCTLQAATSAVAAMSSTADLVVVRGTVTGATAAFAVPAKKKLSVVGQMTAFIAGGLSPAFRLSSGEAYLRDLKLTTAASIGCQADTGTLLRLDHVTVTGNAGGGILLDGAAFEIRNSTVTSNGPAVQGAVSWGGIFANNPPAAGPKILDLLTVQGNLSPGITCSSAITGTGVLASSNLGGDVISTCGFAPCTAASASCGAR